MEYNFFTYKGNIQGSVGEYYWSNALISRNDQPFKDIGLKDERIYHFCSKIVGYPISNGVFPYCRSKEDVIKVCKTLQRIIETTTFTFTKESGDPLMGDLKKDENGYYWNSASWGNDVCFNIIPVNKSEFQQSILGYKSSGTFPYCKSKADLIELCEALEKYNTERFFIPKETLDIPSEFTFSGKTGNISGEFKYTTQWYWNAYSSSNDDCFRDPFIEKTELQKEVLGYKDTSGIFPYCRTKEDLYKFCLAIEKIRKASLTPSSDLPDSSKLVEEGSTYIPKMDYKIPSPVLINVPKI